MRAGLIIGGVFVMLIAAFCFFTIILFPLAILFGLVGFIMLIVGLFTSAHKPQPIQITQQVTTPAPQALPTAPYPAPEVLAICPKCKARVPLKARFCSECGADLRPKRRKS